MNSKEEKPVVSPDYRVWVEELRRRYRATQIKAAVAVNSALIEFYWNLGRDIGEKYPGKVRNAEFFKRLSADLTASLPDATHGLSKSNIRYAFRFYELFACVQQVAEHKRKCGSYVQQVAEHKDSAPWQRCKLCVHGQSPVPGL